MTAAPAFPVLQQPLQTGRVGAGAAGLVVGEQDLADGFLVPADNRGQVGEQAVDQRFRRQAVGLGGGLPEPVAESQEGGERGGRG